MEPMDIDDEYKSAEDDDVSESNAQKKKKSNINKTKSLGKGYKQQTKPLNKQTSSEEFMEYFNSFRAKEEFMQSENDAVNKFNFDIDSFNQVTDPIESISSINHKRKKKANPHLSLINTFYQSHLTYEMSEKVNKINKYNLFDLIVELLTNSSNIFLYGFGSKLRLVYDFVDYFQENINGTKEHDSYHLLVFNLFNPEHSLKAILNEIQAYVIKLFETLYDFKGISEGLRKHRSVEEQIQTINTLIQQLELKGFTDRFLIVFNNIEGLSFMNKAAQGYLSLIANLNGVNVIATCDNINLVYLWNQMIKDNFAFYFLKFHTFTPYDVEISDMNSLCGEKSLKSGAGLKEIFKSFSKAQKAIIKAIAELQVKEDYEKMTKKALVDYFIDSGSGVCVSQNKLSELLVEALDHDIIQVKTMKNNKEILKLNLDKEIIQQIIQGDYDL